MSAKRLQRVAKLARNPFAQPDIRMREMQKLLHEGSPESIKALLQRFTVDAQGTIADEEEKKWLESALVDLGDKATQPLKDYIANDSKLTYAIRALTCLQGEEPTLHFLLQILSSYSPEDHRSSETKLQLLWQLAEYLTLPFEKHIEAILHCLLPLLEDHSDEVRFALLEILQQRLQPLPHPNPEDLTTQDAKVFAEKIRQQPLLQQAIWQSLASTSNSNRLNQKLVEISLHLGEPWPEALSLPIFLQHLFFLDKKRYLRRK